LNRPVGARLVWTRLGIATSELAVARGALATATANLRTRKDAYDDVLVRLEHGR